MLRLQKQAIDKNDAVAQEKIAAHAKAAGRNGDFEAHRRYDQGLMIRKRDSVEE